MTKPKKKNEPKNEYPWSRVVHTFFEGSFKIINTGKIYPLVALLLLVIIMIVVFRAPEEALGQALLIFMNKVVVTYGGLITLLALSNALWRFLWVKQRDNYEKEIKRLTDERRDLMHNPDRKIIKNHRSTEDDCKETFIMPSLKQGSGDESDPTGEGKDD